MPSGGTPAAGVFTSGLSCGEFLLAAEAGFESAGVVMGSSVCHVGLQPPVTSVAQLTGPSYGTMYSLVPQDGGELTELEHAMRTARNAALKRLEDDARAVGADGIIGVNVETAWDSWYDGALEFVLTGTAVRRTKRATAGRWPAGGEGDPPVFTTGLSGQDFWALLRSGYRPAGLVMGYCAYVAEPEFAATTRELRGPTRAVYTAREKAVERMRSQAGQLRAKGIVGVRLDGLDGLSRLPDARVLEFRATGTAVTPIDGVTAVEPPAPVLPVSN